MSYMFTMFNTYTCFVKTLLMYLFALVEIDTSISVLFLFLGILV